MACRAKIMENELYNYNKYIELCAMQFQSSGEMSSVSSLVGFEMNSTNIESGIDVFDDQVIRHKPRGQKHAVNLTWWKWEQSPENSR